jgi:hypothetical protein
LHFTQSASFLLVLFSSWSTLLVRKPSKCSTSLIPEVSHTLSPHSLNLRDTVSPQTGLLRYLLGGDQDTLLSLKGRFIIRTGSLLV